MIKTEIIEINDRLFIHTYSDQGYQIERDGMKYSDAIDLITSDYVYIETDEKIEEVG